MRISSIRAMPAVTNNPSREARCCSAADGSNRGRWRVGYATGYFGVFFASCLTSLSVFLRHYPLQVYFQTVEVANDCAGIQALFAGQLEAYSRDHTRRSSAQHTDSPGLGGFKLAERGSRR